ncbi:MAG: MobC family plasmid mobilization relaxosome protein [Planctomycetes bacterium]|nr:MobC family plasmid mobilization relaxosome protein [Planctomycetota bacterium]
MALRPFIFLDHFGANRIMARPKKSKEERLTERLEIRLTSSGYAKLADASGGADMTITDYARQQILNGQVVIHQTRKLDHATLDQLRRIGILLNQLTKTANATGKISPEIVRLSERIDRLIEKNIDDF